MKLDDIQQGFLGLLTAGIAALAIAGAACEAPKVSREIDRRIDTIEVGRTVSVKGEVDEIYGTGAFVLEPDETLEDAQIVVVPRDGLAGIAVDDEVIVMGSVERMTVADIERKCGQQLDRLQLASDNVLVARAVTVTRDGDDWF